MARVGSNLGVGLSRWPAGFTTGRAFNFKFKLQVARCLLLASLVRLRVMSKKQTKTAGSSAIKQAPYCILVVRDLTQYTEGPLLVCGFVALGAILVTVVSLLPQVEAAVSLTGFKFPASESDSESDPA